MDEIGIVLLWEEKQIGLLAGEEGEQGGAEVVEEGGDFRVQDSAVGLEVGKYGGFV